MEQGKALHIENEACNSLMQKCMNFLPEHRPSFKEIGKLLTEIDIQTKK